MGDSHGGRVAWEEMFEITNCDLKERLRRMSERKKG